MKKFIQSLVLAATAVTGLSVAAPAAAQRGYDNYNYNQAMRDYRRELRQYRRWQRYDYNNPDPRYGAYYADRYYRDGRYYRQRQLSSNDRVYRGYDGRYYCRRSDGTTGLIIGAGVGALFGNAIDNGRSSLLGTILGGVAGGAIGREVERSGNRNRSVACR